MEFDYFSYKDVNYTIFGLKNPLYSSWSVWGRSQWKRVTKGWRPALIEFKLF
jgi:hypothetical protein